jgi:predicted CoA-binding protein
LDTIHPPADLVQIFRRPEDLHQHVDQLIAAAPRVVWMQLGIQHAEIAERLARSGIHVIQNRCLQVELAKRDH